MKRIFIIGIFLFFCMGSYILTYNLNTENPEIDLDGNFEKVLNEIDNYGGAMIVSYDTDTGEIINKRRVGEEREAGVLSITEDAYDINKEGWPEGTLAISRNMSPSDVIEYGGNN